MDHLRTTLTERETVYSTSKRSNSSSHTVKMWKSFDPTKIPHINDGAIVEPKVRGERRKKTMSLNSRYVAQDKKEGCIHSYSKRIDKHSLKETAIFPSSELNSFALVIPRAFAGSYKLSTTLRGSCIAPPRMSSASSEIFFRRR